MITPTIPSIDRTHQHDGLHLSALTNSHHRSHSGVNWGSVLAGAIIAFATQIVLTLIGAAIGLATINPASGDSPDAAALASSAGIWLIITSLLSLFLGGYVAARLAGRSTGWLHGLTTWATLTLATLLLLATAAGQLIGTASGLTSLAANNVDKASQFQLPSAVQQQLDQLKTQAGQGADQATVQAQTTDPQTREAQARDLGQKASKGSAVGAGAAALAMILGAFAAAIGGKVGQRDPHLELDEVDPTHSHGETVAHRS